MKTLVLQYPRTVPDILRMVERRAHAIVRREVLNLFYREVCLKLGPMPRKRRLRMCRRRLKQWTKFDFNKGNPWEKSAS